MYRLSHTSARTARGGSDLGREPRSSIRAVALGLGPAGLLSGRLPAHPGHVGRVGHGHPVDDDPLSPCRRLPSRVSCSAMCHESLLFDVS